SAVAVANAMMLRGWARVILGDIENGLGIMREGLAAWRQTGSAFRVPERLARAADAYRLANHPDEAAGLAGLRGWAERIRTRIRWNQCLIPKCAGDSVRCMAGAFKWA